MHHHLQERYCRDPDILEVMGIAFPWLSISDSFLLIYVIGIEGIAVRIDQLDIIVELYEEDGELDCSGCRRGKNK